MREIEINKIIRSRRRTLALVITKDALLEVRAPFYAPLNYILKFVKQKQHWIRRKQEFILENIVKNTPKKFLDGEEFLHLGKTYPLKIFDANKIVLADCLHFPSILLGDAKKYLTKWYKQQAEEIITERVVWYANLVGLKYKTIKITSAKTRWGSCGVHGNLNFTWRLIMAPPDVVDYVVVHELAHLVVHNHSKRFWLKVEDIMPNYKEKRVWLRKNGKSLGF